MTNGLATEPQGPTDPPLGKLVSDLASQTGTLFRQEVALAKLEMTEKVRLAGKDVAMMSAGGVAAVLGSLVLVAALVLLLGLVMPLWASALIVGLVFTGAGVSVAYGAYRSLSHIDPAPRQSIEALKETKAWVSLEMAK